MAFQFSQRPANQQEWVRWVENRLAKMENRLARASVSVGDWRLVQDETGRVVAAHRPSGTRVVLAEPGSGEL